MIVHFGNTDRNGNFRDTSRKKSGYIGDQWGITQPFEALVTAWYPSSQVISVSVSTPWGQREIENVIVYGPFGESIGEIVSPAIATSTGASDEQTWQIYRNANQEEPANTKYVLNNHIAALVHKTNIGFATNSFRFLTSDSILVRNAKTGRSIKRHSDGSYLIHDEDGNIQFKHPSGYSVKTGDTTDDISLDVSFPEHARNKQKYNGKIAKRIVYPSSAGEIEVQIDGQGGVALNHPVNDFVLEVNDQGKIKLAGTDIDLKTIFDTLIDITVSVDGAATGGSNATALNNLKTTISTLLQ